MAALIRMKTSHDPHELEELVSGEELVKCKELKEKVKDARADQYVRFLRARKGNVENAAKMLQDHLKFRETFPGTLTPDVKDELQKAKYCHFGHDIEGKKVVIIRLRLMGKHTYDDMDVVKASLIYLAEYMESQLEPLEKFTVLFSRLDAVRKNSDLDWVKGAANLFQNNYPERLSRALIGPINVFFRGLWQIAKYFFDPETRKKIVLAESSAKFLEWVQEDKLPVELGGNNEKEISPVGIIEYAANYKKPEDEETDDLL